jgi:hypothetical protein
VSRTVLSMHKGVSEMSSFPGNATKLDNGFLDEVNGFQIHPNMFM